MSNPASLIPAPAVRPPLPKADYQAAAPEGSGFSDLLDTGTEAHPAPRKSSPPRADDVREAKRSDESKNDNEPARAENDRPQEPRDQAAAAPARADEQTVPSKASKDDTGAGTAETDDTAATIETDTQTSNDGDQNAEAAIAAAAAAALATTTAEAIVPVVTPVAIALIVEQTANTANTAATDAVGAIASGIITPPGTAEAKFSLTIASEKAIPATPAQPTKVDEAVAEAHAAIVAAAQPAQPSLLKQAAAPKTEKSAEADNGDIAKVESAETKGALTEAEQAEFLKSMQAAKEGKPPRPEHLADANIDTKTSSDAAPAPVAATNAATPSQTPIQAGFAQATTAVNGVHAADPRNASDPAADAAVPVASLAIEIATRAREGKNRFEIRLDPAELGRIDVRLDIDRQGNVTSRLLVERADTLDLLRRDFSNLERALNDAGLKTDSGSLQFAMRDQGFTDSGQQQNEFTRSARIIVPGETDTVLPAARYNIAQRSGVDIRV